MHQSNVVVHRGAAEVPMNVQVFDLPHLPVLRVGKAPRVSHFDHPVAGILSTVI